MFTSSWAHSDDSFDAATDRADAMVVEVSLLWGDSTLAVRHVQEGETLTVGGEGADLLVAQQDQSDPVTIQFAKSGVTVSPNATTTVVLDGWPRELAPFDLAAGHHAELMMGAFTLRLRVLAAGKITPVGWADRVREAALGGVGMSFVVHASLVAALAFFMPSLGSDDSESIDRDRMYAMKAMLEAAADRERDRVEESSPEPSPANAGEASGGGRAIGAEGKMGTTTARSSGHYAAKGDAKEVTLQKREELVEMAKTFGMTALVGSLSSAMAQDAPTVPWDSVLNGMDDRNHRGDFWSQNLGDAFGSGLGFSGGEEGGGGNNIGIGINDIGGLGRSLDGRLGNGKCTVPPCDGIGIGNGRLPRGHVPKGPIMRTAKTEVEGGRLPAEVIQRIVRMSHGRFRNCYDTGLRSNPSLGGRVAVRFVIDRTGGVSLASDAGSDLPDEGVRQCVVKAFYSLSFPSPENGQVRVTYPLIFSPAD